MYFERFEEKYSEDNDEAYMFTVDILELGAQAYDCLLDEKVKTEDEQLDRAIKALECVALEYWEDKLLMKKVATQYPPIGMTPDFARELYGGFKEQFGSESPIEIVRSNIHYQLEMNRDDITEEYRKNAHYGYIGTLCASFMYQAIKEIEELDPEYKMKFVKDYLEGHKGIKDKDIKGYDDAVEFKG